MFILRILKAEILSNKSKLVILLLALSITSTLIFSLFVISTGIREKLFNELKMYGANLIIYPEGISQTIGIGKIYSAQVFEEKYIPEEDIKNLFIDFKDLIDDAEFNLYRRAKLNNIEIDVIGIEFEKIKESRKWWKIEGKYPAKENEVIIGQNIAKYFKLKKGGNLSLSFKDKKMQFSISGTLKTDGQEENNIYVNLGNLQNILGLKRKINLCFLMVKTQQQSLENIIYKFKFSSKNLDFIPIKNVQYASESLLRKIKYLMLFVTIYVTCQTLLSISSTIGIFIQQKKQEIGVMLALGGKRIFIVQIFVLEAIFIGLVSGVLGLFFGIAVSQTVSKQVFNSYISIKWIFFLIPILSGIFISITSFLLPLKRVMLVSPCDVLRGE